MGARTDFEPLSWEEAEQNRRERAHRPMRCPEAEIVSVKTAQTTSLSASHLPAGSAPAGHIQNHGREQRECLRDEIKRGREYLAQVERDLAESRSALDQWPAYERNCGSNPLAQLTKSVYLNERMQQFLLGWLKRRECRLETMLRQPDCFSVGSVARTKDPVTGLTPKARNRPHTGLARPPLCRATD